MKYHLKFAVCVATSLLVASCATGPGAAPSAIAPHLIRSKNVSINTGAGCKDENSAAFLEWDHPGAFGPVPASLQSAGDEACHSDCNMVVAVGYHPAAVDSEGHAGDGFLCAPKKK